MDASTAEATGSAHEIPPFGRQGLRPRPHEGHLGGRARCRSRRTCRSTRRASGSNLRHWVDDLGIDGVFIAGKQSEFFSMSVAERKRSMEIVVDEIGNKRRRHRVVLRPEHGHGDRACQARPGDRRALHRRACAGAALPAHSRTRRSTSITRRSASRSTSASRCGATGLRLSDEPGAVRADRRTAEHRRDQIQRAARDVCAADAAGRRQDPGLSTASEEEWFDNIVELGWRLYLCSSPPYLFQTKVDRRMREYTDLAFAGEVAQGAR